MKFEDNMPIYIQIMDLIKSKISSGEIKGGSKLPSVRDYSQSLKVNPNTIQRAYKELEMEKLVFTKRGRGTFVTEDESKIKELKNKILKDIVDDFLNDILSLGYDYKDILDILENYSEKGRANSGCYKNK